MPGSGAASNVWSVKGRIGKSVVVRSKGSVSRSPKERKPLGRQAWLKVARQALIEEGTAGVEINKLAKRLRVSRGGCYWFFKDRQHLLDELLAYWAETGTAAYERILRGRGHDGMRKLRAFADLWIDADDDLKWDCAVRDWARTSFEVRKAVQAVDDNRVAVLEQVFRDLGYRGQDAHVRARITYYHQVGYSAIGVRESRRQRVKLVPFYTRVLTGR